MALYGKNDLETAVKKAVVPTTTAKGDENPTGGDNGDTGGGTTGVNNDKYKALETTSYKEIMSGKIQAANVKEQALKNLGTTLNANGMGTQGYSESARVGVANNYANAIAKLDEQHAQNVMDIEQQKQEDLEARRFRSSSN